MQLYFIVSLLFACLVAIFALQNSSTVAIQFLTWELTDISQVLIIFTSAAIGALAVMFLGLGKQLKLIFQLRQLTHQKKQLEEEVLALKRLLDELRLPDQEEETESESLQELPVPGLHPVPGETKPRTIATATCADTDQSKTPRQPG
jgi:uncharacterized integral membrane protein